MRITLAGVVGVGKSTVSKLLGKKHHYMVMDEPVEENPYLDQYYADPKDMAFKMQVYMVMARSKQLKQAKITSNIIFDRSILEDPIFVDVLYELGYMNTTDYKVYKEFYDVVVLQSLYLDENIKPELVVYLRVDPEIAMERITKRGRASEQNIGSAYWTLLNRKYEEWYERSKDKFNFLVIDANHKTPEEIVAIISEKLIEKK
ncbi:MULTISPECIES: deoxynucleoside kinase [Spiroplasma]|uniref:AAA family ATPase n=3 Tax=Spiroplasma TaxID=2132 RepID=Q14P17_SPICI|nr:MULTISPECIES: deoxynucleoside kinase [Spiroplasma]APE74432.1 deoxynucleoside kinase [Spiroplasma citri]ELL44279.1 deoxyadenosine/deoxycytidine kinase [Spiroplasma melliferum IPMB4A]KAI92249.1 deoxyguanosine kinase [Spiroplasma melliferum KC3]QCO23671.1 deoxynucleoside kinase [Spiroplasma melliferum]QED24361.1 deoxynucleoside kinase [Spiroplasma citri]